MFNSKWFFSSLSKIYFGLGCCLLLTACGFHLRQQPTLPAVLQTLYLQSNDPYGQFEASLKHALQLEGASLTSTPQQAPLILTVLDKNYSATPTSIGTSSQARAFILTFRASYHLTNPQGKILYQSPVVSASNTLTLNANQLLESNDQQAQMLRQLQNSVIRQIILQLGSKQAQQTVQQPPT